MTKDIVFEEITDDNLEMACRAHRNIDDLLISMKEAVKLRIQYRKLTEFEVKTYKEVMLINDALIDSILEFVNKKGYTLVPIN